MTLGTAPTGEWVKCEKARGAGYTCGLCSKLFQKGWQFFVNQHTSTASVCDGCAEGLLDG